MRVPVKLAAFGLSLAAVFGVSAAIGAAVGPLDVGPDHVETPVPPTVPTGHGGHTP